MLELEGTIKDPTGQATVSFVKFDSWCFEPSQPQSFGKGALRGKGNDSNR